MQKMNALEHAMRNDRMSSMVKIKETSNQGTKMGWDGMALLRYHSSYIPSLGYHNLLFYLLTT